jgi:predicted RNase H-related nuclease YkuK (DUF458 family)
MLTEFDIENLVDLLSKLSTDTKVYLGCDSIRFIDKKGTRMARYATVLIVHMNGNKGCKIFSNISYEKDFDIKKSRPKMRLLNEVRKVCELYHQVIPFIDEYEVEVHLDINTDPKHGSNCVAQEAAGYVLGMTGIELGSKFWSRWSRKWKSQVNPPRMGIRSNPLVLVVVVIIQRYNK